MRTFKVKGEDVTVYTSQELRRMMAKLEDFQPMFTSQIVLQHDQLYVPLPRDQEALRSVIQAAGFDFRSLDFEIPQDWMNEYFQKHQEMPAGVLWNYETNDAIWIDYIIARYVQNTRYALMTYLICQIDGIQLTDEEQVQYNEVVYTVINHPELRDRVFDQMNLAETYVIKLADKINAKASESEAP